MEDQKELKICQMHKTQLRFVCINLKCKLERFICQKCAVNHNEHENDLVEIDNLIENKSNTNQHIPQFTQQLQSLIFKQSDPIFKIYEFFNSLDYMKSRIESSIKSLKDKYLSQLQVYESFFDPQPIFDSYKNYEKNCKQIDSYLQNVAELNDRILKDKIDFKIDTSQVIQNIDVLKQNLQDLSKNIQKSSINNSINHTSNQDKNEISKEKIPNKVSTGQFKQATQDSKLNNNDKIDNSQSKADLVIKNKSLFQNLMEPLNKKNINYDNISQLINKKNTYQIEFDGCSRGNPGISGVGFLIKEKSTGKLIREFAVNVGNRTNNQSEYLAAIYGLYVSLKVGITNIYVQGDSQLVINQILGKYKVKSENVQLYHELCNQFKLLFDKIELQHVKREFNSHADKLSNDALDKPN